MQRRRDKRTVQKADGPMPPEANKRIQWAGNNAGTSPVELSSWMIRPIPPTADRAQWGVAVHGMRDSSKNTKKLYKSTEVAERVTSRELRTHNGTR